MCFVIFVCVAVNIRKNVLYKFEIGLLVEIGFHQ
jgi:hypothetical protein